MTDTDPHTDDLFSTMTPAGDGKLPAQPERSPDLTEVEPDDGFDEEYVFEPSPIPVPPTRAPEPESEDLAEDGDWEIPIETAPAEDDRTLKPKDDAKPAAPSDGASDPAKAIIVDTASTGAVVKPRFERMTVSIVQVMIWIHAVIDPSRVAGVEIERRANEINAIGQTRYPQARKMPDGRFEIANGVLDVLAVQFSADNGGVHQIHLDVWPLSDVGMFRYAHLEGQAGVRVLAYDRARSIRAALDMFGGTQRDVAETLGLDEASVTNSLHILKVERELGGLLSDPWRITENQAKRFQKIWSDPARRKAAAEMIAGFNIGTARAHLTTLFEAFPTPSKSERPITDAKGQQLGTLRRSAGRLVIELGAEADAIPADDLGALIAAEIGASRK